MERIPVPNPLWRITSATPVSVQTSSLFGYTFSPHRGRARLYVLRVRLRCTTMGVSSPASLYDKGDHNADPLHAPTPPLMQTDSYGDAASVTPASLPPHTEPLDV